MMTIQFQNNKLLAIVHSIRLVLRWYVIFSIQTALIFVLARLSQNMISLVIINSKIASAVGFLIAGISGVLQFISERRKASVLIYCFLECSIYAIIFYLCMFIQTILKGFSL